MNDVIFCNADHRLLRGVRVLRDCYEKNITGAFSC